MTAYLPLVGVAGGLAFCRGAGAATRSPTF